MPFVNMINAHPSNNRLACAHEYVTLQALVVANARLNNLDTDYQSHRRPKISSPRLFNLKLRQKLSENALYI